MITLAVPKAGVDRYFPWMGAVFGPFDRDFKSDRDPIQFQSKLSAFEQSTGMWHENNVLHDKIQGDLTYHPILECSIPTPTAEKPNRMKFPVWDLLYTPPNGAVWLEPDHGLAVHNESTLAYTAPGPSQVWTRQGYYQDPNNPAIWRVVSVDGFVTTPTLVATWFEYEITGYRVSGTSGRFYLDFTRQQYSVPSKGHVTPIDWTKGKLSFDEILGHRPPVAREKAVSNSFTKVYPSRCNAILNPKTAREQIDVLIYELFPEEFPIEEVHYGNLAMSASKKVNVNDVNMLAFLADLRSPAKSAANLANLKKLPRNLKKIKKRTKELKSVKGASGAYLGTKYGVLPTISDLKEIYKAMEAIKPYFDYNGFKTYSAGYQEDLKVDGFNFHLNQHVKLAIDDEDSDMMRLLNQIESIGFLPKLENLWDLVGYSFVVDWFVDVGGLLERVDSGIRIARMNIRYVTQSRKKITSGYLTHAKPNFPFTGAVEWVHYHRWVSDQCPVPPISLETTFQDFNHWLESGALLAQRTKRR